MKLSGSCWKFFSRESASLKTKISKTYNIQNYKKSPPARTRRSVGSQQFETRRAWLGRSGSWAVRGQLAAAGPLNRRRPAGPLVGHSAGSRFACLGRRSRRLQSTTGGRTSRRLQSTTGGRTSRRLQSTTGGRTSRRLQSTTGTWTSRRLRRILRQGGLCAATAAHPGSPWRQLPFCRLIHQSACSDRAVAPRTAENAPGGKTPKQTLTGELISIYISYKLKNSRTRGVSEWISICFELSSGNSNQNAENPGPRNVSECLDLFDSSFRSKFETDRDIPRHSGALDFRRFDSSFQGFFV